MFIAIIGTPSAGKRTLLDYLVSKHGFTQIGLDAPSDEMDAARLSSAQLDVPAISSLSLADPSRPTVRLCPHLAQNGARAYSQSPIPSTSSTSFASPAIMLDYVTHNWLTHTVTTDLRTFDEIDPFLKRPFFLLVAVDGPMRNRFERERERRKASGRVLTIDEFVETHDILLNGPPLPTDLPPATFSHHPQTDFSRVMKLANVSVCNNLPSVPALWAYLDQLNLMDEERLRPGWDTYFMTLASLASHRSNCMKRRVGALLVRSKRILSTGYNGTPRGIRNCNQGGCRRCNGSARGGEALDECLCLHAEENALLEAGRERIGDDSVIYCNTCPCLRCSVKIVQTGVREVVYNQSYSMDAASAMVLKEGGVILRQLHMPPI